MDDAVATLEAQKIARPVRGCATDEQFTDLANRIAAALRAERERANDLLIKNNKLAEVIVDLDCKAAAMRAALEECSADLAAEVEAQYQDSKQYPGELRRYKLAIAPVEAARKALATDAGKSMPAELAALKAALKKYGAHEEDCAPEYGACDCGFEAALAILGKEPSNG